MGSQRRIRRGGAKQQGRIPASEELERVERALRLEISKRFEAERVIRKQAAALAQTKRLLLSEPALPDFIRALLHTINQECGGLWTTLWMISGSGADARRESFSWMDAATREQVEKFADAHPVAMRRLARLCEELLDGHRSTVVLSAEDRRNPAVIRRFYRTMKVRSALMTPFVVKDRLVGWLSHLSFVQPSRVNRDNVAFIEAAAAQATLAMQMAKLAEVERAAEEAFAREAAAAEQEQELREINQLLDAGGGGESSGGLLRSVLVNVLALMDADWGALWRCGRDGLPSTPIWMGARGEVTAPEELVAIDIACQVRARHPRLLRRWESARQPMIEKRTGSSGRRLLASIGVSDEADGALEVLPLRIDDENVGFLLIVGDPGKRRPGPRAVAVRALAMQAALALRLEAMSEVKRSAAIARERARISRDLHDLLAQSFSAISLQIEAMQAECRGLPGQWTARLERIRETAVRSVDDLRRTLQMLGPAALDRRPITEALEELVRNATPRPGWSVNFVNRAGRVTLHSRIEIHLFAIVSEALQNALVHSEPGGIEVSVTGSVAELCIAVESPGRLKRSPKPGGGIRPCKHEGPRGCDRCAIVHRKPAGTDPSSRSGHRFVSFVVVVLA